MWTKEQILLFTGALMQIWCERTSDPTLLFLQYVAGDYAKAIERIQSL